MSKRQSKYLDSLLGDPLSPPSPSLIDDPNASPAQSRTASSDLPSPPLSQALAAEPQAIRGTTLLGRESALARIATGEVKQVTQISLDPARVRIWTGNARHQASLSEETCGDLIDAILAEGGQKVPAIVRRVADDPNHDYEVIAGTRRHFAISWLRANNYPDMAFVAQVQNLDDESAFRLADIENRARKDVSDFERARNYRDALAAHYGGRQNRMAERLRLSKGWLSKMLAVANLPDWAVAAFASPTEIQLKTCYVLAQHLNAMASRDSRTSPQEIKATRNAAEQIAIDQAARRQAGRSMIPSSDVIARLMNPQPSALDDDLLFACDSEHGRRALSVLSANRNGVTVRLHAGSGASPDDLAGMLRAALAHLEKQGRALTN
jgi:ParB family chromosome partitioning protein